MHDGECSLNWTGLYTVRVAIWHAQMVCVCIINFRTNPQSKPGRPKSGRNMVLRLSRNWTLDMNWTQLAEEIVLQKANLQRVLSWPP